MKNTKFNLFFTALIFCTLFSYAQINANDAKLKERMDNKVQIFSPKEKDSMQIWFYNQTSKLGLSPEVRDQYTQILNDNIFDMSRLNDKDKAYTKEEQLERLELIAKKINTTVQPLFNDNQYMMHLDNYNALYKWIVNKLYEQE